MAAPFLTYLTVFKARLGVANLVLDRTGFENQPDATLSRRLEAVLQASEKLSPADPKNAAFFAYLKEKGLIGPSARRTGRYASYRGLAPDGEAWKVMDRRGEAIADVVAFDTDRWLANPEVPSTVGVPTPENVGEAIELVFQLGLLTRAKNTWTAAGQLTHGLRERFPEAVADISNPFLLGVETIALLRQVISVDGLLLREVARAIVDTHSPLVTRDDVVGLFPETVERAVTAARGSHVYRTRLPEAVTFLALIRRSARQVPSGRGREATRGPGVLEHRSAARLEWLTDWGYLRKSGLPKNAFQYEVSDSLGELLDDLDAYVGDGNWAEEVALSQWRRNPHWSNLRQLVGIGALENAFHGAYGLMHRRIGPAPLREVAFAAALLSGGQSTFRGAVDALISFAGLTPGVSLAGGRYRRSPENIFIADFEGA